MKNDELIDYILDLDYQFVMLLDYMMLIANSFLTGWSDTPDDASGAIIKALWNK